jgi:ABC-type bacteriocin/lantibiotic exporter with double-glycine peptidase domain
MYLKTQTNFAIKSEIKQALQSNYHEFQRIYIDQTKFISALEFLETIGVNILYMALVMVGCYLIVEKQTLNIGQLIFLISLSVMMSASFNNTCGFVIKQIEYKQMVEIYQNFINIGNATSNGTIVTTDIRSIKLISDGKETMLSNGQRFSRFAHHYIDTITLDVENDHKQLLINDINVKELDYESYTSLIFTFNSSTKVSAK